MSFAGFETNIVGLAADGRSRLFRRFGKRYQGLGQLREWPVHVGNLACFADDSVTATIVRAEMVAYLQAETVAAAADASLAFRIAAGSQAHRERDALLFDPLWARRLMDSDIALIPSTAVLGTVVRRLAAIEPDLVKLIVVALARTFPPRTRSTRSREVVVGLLRQTPYYAWRLPI